MAEVIDIDSHVYEPAALRDEYISPGERGAAKAGFHHNVDDEGNRTTISTGPPAGINRSKIVRQAVWRPGMSVEQIGGLDPGIFPGLTPGAFDPKARLRDLDAMGVAQQIVFPTLFGEYLPQVIDQTAAVTWRGSKDRVWDFASEGEGRLHPVAVSSAAA